MLWVIKISQEPLRVFLWRERKYLFFCVSSDSLKKKSCLLYIIRLSPARHANVAFEWDHSDTKLVSKVDMLYSKSHTRVWGEGPWKAPTFMYSVVPVAWDIWKTVLGLLIWETLYVLIEADQLQYVLPTPLALLPPTVWIVGSLCPILGSLIVWQEAV